MYYLQNFKVNKSCYTIQEKLGILFIAICGQRRNFRVHISEYAQSRKKSFRYNHEGHRLTYLLAPNLLIHVQPDHKTNAKSD